MKGFCLFFLFTMVAPCFGEVNPLVTHLNGYGLEQGITHLLRQRHYAERDKLLSIFRNRRHVLPCAAELAAYKGTVPEIILHGEQHDHAGCIADHDVLIEHSSKKAIVLAEEGGLQNDVYLNDRGEVVTHRFGLEDGNSVVLSILTLIYANNAHAVPGAEPGWVNTSWLFEEQPLREGLRRAWPRLDFREYRSATQREWLRLFRDFLAVPDPVSEARQKKFVERAEALSAKKDGLAALQPILRDWIFVQGKILREESPRHAPNEIGLHLAMYLDEIAREDLSQTLSHEVFTLQIRNQHMIDAIAKRYCETYKRGVPFHILVGNGHAADIHEALKEMFLPVMRRPWVTENIVYRNSVAINEWWDQLTAGKDETDRYPDRPLHLDKDSNGNPIVVKQVNGRRWVLALVAPPAPVSDSLGRPLAVVGKPWYFGGGDATPEEITRATQQFEKETLERYADDRKIGPLLKEAGLRK